MTQHRDIERLLDHWFADGPDQAPDRVIDIVTDRIERQCQRPAWRLRLEALPMNHSAKLAVAAAAVLIVAVVGYNLLPGRSTASAGPRRRRVRRAPTATPSDSPIAQRAAFPPGSRRTAAAAAGILSLGSQTTRSVHARLPRTASPEGWVNSADESDFSRCVPDTSRQSGRVARSGERARAICDAASIPADFVCDAVENNRGRLRPTMVAAAAANDVLAVSRRWSMSRRWQPDRQAIRPPSSSRLEGRLPGRPTGGWTSAPALAVFPSHRRRRPVGVHRDLRRLDVHDGRSRGCSLAQAIAAVESSSTSTSVGRAITRGSLA